MIFLLWLFISMTNAQDVETYFDNDYVIGEYPETKVYICGYEQGEYDCREIKSVPVPAE